MPQASIPQAFRSNQVMVARQDGESTLPGALAVELIVTGLAQ